MKGLRVFWLAFLGVALSARYAYAHGLGERPDEPLPINLSLIAAAGAVALSFAIVGVAFRTHREDGTYWRHDLWKRRWFRGSIGHPLFLTALKAISASMLFLVVATGILGNQNPVRNFSPTFVWIVWWVGLAFVTPLIGNVWAIVNPWKVIFEWVERLFMGHGQALSLRLPYPRKAGIWPAFLLFLAFAWVENVAPFSATPLSIARLAILYSLITWAGMFAFGKHVWLRNGEVFNVFYEYLARFAPTEVHVVDREVCQDCPLGCKDDPQCVDCSACWERSRSVSRPVVHARSGKPSRRRTPEATVTREAARELNLRPYAVGLLRDARAGWDRTVFVLLMLSTVSFDGLSGTSAWTSISAALTGLVAGPGEQSRLLTGTLGLVALPLVFLGVYLGFAYLMGVFAGAGRRAGMLARSFAYTLIPIALAYHLSHFLGLLLVQGQRLIPLLSDPFGYRWDLLGTADYSIHASLITARFIWFFAVGAIVLGHVIAVYLAHRVALRTFGEHRLALRSQYPMLVLMVGYTVSSLWILAQPIVQ